MFSSENVRPTAHGRCIATSVAHGSARTCWVGGCTEERGIGATKSHGENMAKRKALANATNMGIMHTEGCMDADGTLEETHRLETGMADTPEQVWMERNIHTALSKNLSIPNMVQAGSSRKAVESVQQPRRTQSLWRECGQFDLYAQGYLASSVAAKDGSRKRLKGSLHSLSLGYINHDRAPGILCSRRCKQIWCMLGFDAQVMFAAKIWPG